MKFLFTNDPPLIKYGIAAGIKQIGHDARVMQGEYRLWGMDADTQKIRLTEAIEEYRPDCVFTEGFPAFDAPLICEIVQKYGIPHFYWAIEDPVCTDLALTNYAPWVDTIFTTAIECIPKYLKMGKKAELLLFGCNPDIHRFTGENPGYRHDLVLVASNYSSRYDEVRWFILPLIEKGYVIKIWGRFWDDPNRPVNLINYPSVYGGILPYEELADVYSSATIVLGINCDDSSKTQTSMRPYEALACGGGLYLGHYTKAQEYLFKDLIFQVRNTTETLATVNRILEMPEIQRKEMAKRAQSKLYEQHSYSRRALTVVNAFQRLAR